MLLNRGVLTTNGVVDRLMKSRISRIHVKQDIFFEQSAKVVEEWIPTSSSHK